MLSKNITRTPSSSVEEGGGEWLLDETSDPMMTMLNNNTGGNTMADVSMATSEGGGRRRDPYSSLAMILTAIPVGSIIVSIVFGNALVILAVLRDSQLKRQPQNWLIVSLAAADLLVGLLIMPLTLTYELLDEWALGSVLCELWLALDVLFVTASILNLCAISLDRYWSLTLPTSYPQRRTPCRMLAMILVVWFAAFAISFPPLVGWRPEERAANDCALSDQIGYVMYSAFGSFYIPVAVLLFVYARIYCISRRRKKKNSVVSCSGGPPFIPGPKKLSLASRLRRAFSKRRPKLAQAKPQQPQEAMMTFARNGNCSIRSAPSNGNDGGGTPSNGTPIRVGTMQSPPTSPQSPQSPPQSPPLGTTDYAAVIARVRALASLRQDSFDRRDRTPLSPPPVLAQFERHGSTGGRKLTITSSIGTESPMLVAPEPSSGDGLSHVMTIAAQAAAHSRRETRSESLAAKAYELQTQLRQRRKLVRRRERQATIVLGLVLGSFVVCWMPFFCLYVLQAVGCPPPELVFDIIFWLGYCNSAFNPLIYNFFNRDFRRAFRRILCEPLNRRLSLMSSSMSFQLRGEQQRKLRKRTKSTGRSKHGPSRHHMRTCSTEKITAGRAGEY